MVLLWRISLYWVVSIATRRLVLSVGVITTESGGFWYVCRFDWSICVPEVSHLSIMRAIPPLNSFSVFVDNCWASSLSTAACRLALANRHVLGICFESALTNDGPLLRIFVNVGSRIWDDRLLKPIGASVAFLLVLPVCFRTKFLSLRVLISFKLCWNVEIRWWSSTREDRLPTNYIINSLFQTRHVSVSAFIRGLCSTFNYIWLELFYDDVIKRVVQ